MKATYIGRTNNRGEKDRWECPNCRAKKSPECRFNLSTKKTGGKHKCRYCGTELELIREGKDA